jgi:AcrR family transcriptional regulator
MTIICGSHLDSDKFTLEPNLGSVKIPAYDGCMSRDSYHHGDLKAVILGQAAQLVAERGADGISLRELARAAGVSHAAPAHHFTDRRGLFTALAAEGWRKLAAALTDARPDFIDAALAYVRFALEHPGHYAVMFDRSLVHPEDPELVAAQDAAGAELAQGVGTLDDARAKDDPHAAALAAWSLVHGFSLLWLNKAIETDGDPIQSVERIATMLFNG